MSDNEKKSFLDKAKKSGGSNISKLAKKAPEEKNFMDTLIKSRTDLCYKVAGKDSTGRDAYYFVLIDKDKKEQFLKHKVGDTYNLENYGKIIYSAYGTKVPKDVKIWLKEKYGFDNLGLDESTDDDDDDIEFSLSDYLKELEEEENK